MVRSTAEEQKHCVLRVIVNAKGYKAEQFRSGIVRVPHSLFNPHPVLERTSVVLVVTHALHLKRSSESSRGIGIARAAAAPRSCRSSCAGTVG